jgi:3-oxoacyl-[acyl-carrier protein] reductase
VPVSRRKTLITGASSGIGAATARILAEQAADVWLTYATDESGAEATAAACRETRAEARLSRLDLRSPASIAELCEQVAVGWGALHVLVNNGGICPYRRFDDIGLEEWDDVLETNARGTFLMTRGVLPLLRAAEGDRSIVNVSSIAGQVGGLQTGVHYAASKGAILAITRSFARLLAPERIRVNAVTPGPVSSRITDQLDEEGRGRLLASLPLGRFGLPEDVAATIALLASPASSFTTGATYDINGGVRID